MISQDIFGTGEIRGKIHPQIFLENGSTTLNHRALPSPPPGARSLALDILAAAARPGQSVEERLAAALKRHPGLDRRERALLLELVQGVKRWEVRLDYLLARLSHIPLAKLHPLVLQLLRLGAFQLLWLDRVPARAVLHEAGNLAKARGLPRSHVGFTNAVLRRLAAGEVPALPDVESDPVLALSVIHSHPAWLVRRWLGRYGPVDTAARLAANNLIPPLTVRVNTLKTDPAALMARLAAEGVEARPGRFSPVGLIFEAVHTSPTALASYREGLWMFQDEGAQLAAGLLGLGPGHAPGGDRRRPGRQDHPTGRGHGQLRPAGGAGQPPPPPPGTAAHDAALGRECGSSHPG